MTPAHGLTAESPSPLDMVAEPPQGTWQLADPPIGTVTAMDDDDIPFYPPETAAIFQGYARLTAASAAEAAAQLAGAGVIAGQASARAVAQAAGSGWMVAATAASHAALAATGEFSAAGRARTVSGFAPSPALDVLARVYVSAAQTSTGTFTALIAGLSGARNDGSGALTTKARPRALAGLAMSGTLSATSTLFTPSRMNKNGTFKSSTAAWTQIPNWTPQAGSTVNNHGLVVNGGKANAVLTANIPWSGQVGFRATMQIRIKVDGAVVVTTTPIETSPLTATINRNVSNGSVVTVEISSNSGDLFQPEVAAGTNTYLSIA